MADDKKNKISSVCAWCKAWIRKADESHEKDDINHISHGVCDPCFELLQEEIDESLND